MSVMGEFTVHPSDFALHRALSTVPETIVEVERLVVAFELEKLYEQSQPMAGARYGLTSPQRDALVAAYEAGFFDVPQRTTLTELAEQLGITQRALSKRLHHAHKNLVGNALTVGQVGEGDEADA